MPTSDNALERYLRRIGFAADPADNLATLRAIHALHPQAIPFENLDSWLGLPVVLDEDKLFDKLVGRQRGGYCFEHNLLLQRILHGLGLETRGLSARVSWKREPGVEQPRTHMLLLVTVEGERWIADVGFGGLTMTAPLLLDTETIQATPNEQFRVLRHEGLYCVQALVAGDWRELYRFSLEAQQPADYEMANWYVATHPASRFVRHLIAGCVERDQRHALLDNRYRLHRSSGSEECVLESPAELRQLLEQRLGLDCSHLPGLDRRLASLVRGETR